MDQFAKFKHANISNFTVFVQFNMFYGIQYQYGIAYLFDIYTQILSNQEIL